MFVGGLITWAVSRRYYRKASKDLAAEAGRLREQSNLMLHALQEFSVTGNVEYNRDLETGEPKGLHMKRTATSHMGIGEGGARAETRTAEPESTTEEPND